MRSPEVVEKAIRCFQAQTYGPKELVVLRSGPDAECPLSSVEDWNHNEHCFHVPLGLSIGELRNVAIRESRGSVIAHFDDDDWSHPDRLARSMELIDAGDELVGSSRVIFTDGTRRWLYDGYAAAPYAHPTGEKVGPRYVGGTLVYRRRLWEGQPFDDVMMGEDTRFMAHHYYARVANLNDESLYVARISDDNTSVKDTTSAGWTLLGGE